MKKIYHTPTMTIMAVALNEMVALSGFDSHDDEDTKVTDVEQVWVRGEEPSPWSSVLDDEW